MGSRPDGGDERVQTPNMVQTRFRGISVVALAFGLSVSAACGHGSPKTHASAVCRRALGSRLLNSTPATIAEVRAFAMGPAPLTPLTNAFADESGSAFAAWCWTTKDAEGLGFTAYAVDAHNRKVRVVTLRGTEGTPSGKPMVP
jgi:hypothetical protein